MKSMYLCCTLLLVTSIGLFAQGHTDHQADPNWTDTLRANTLFSRGMALKDSSKFAKSLPFFHESAKIWSALLPNGSLQEASSCLQGGIVYLRMGKYDTAQVWLQRTLVFQEQLLPANHPLPGTTLYWMGLNNMERGLYLDAADNLQKALAIHYVVYGKEHWRTANIINDLGVTKGYLGYFEEALTLQEEALAIRQKVLPPGAPAIARSCMGLGNLHKSMRQFQQALAYFQQARDIYIQNFGEKSNNLAYVYSETGQVFLALKDPVKALDYFEKERNILVATGFENHAVFGYTCIDLGKTYYTLGNYAAALTWHKRAIEFFRNSSGPDNALLATLHHHLGITRSAQGDFDAAFAAFQEDRRILYKLFGPEAENTYTLSSDMADTYARWYAATSADSLLEKSRGYYEQAGRSIAKKIQGETSVIARKKDLYDIVPVMERAIHAEQCHLQKHRDPAALDNAWQYSELVHGFLLHAAAQEADARKFSGIPDDLLQQETDIRTNISFLEKQRAKLTEEQELPLTDPIMLANNARLMEARAAYDHLTATFAANYPEYYHLKYALDPVTLSETQKMLTPQQTLLEYFTGDSSIFIFVVRRDMTQLIPVSCNFPLTQWVDQFRQGMQGYYTAESKTPDTYEQTVRQYAQAAQNLYQKIVAPVANLLTQEVIIVPDAALNYVAFEALLSAAPADPANFKTYPFLLSQHLISYAYSATTLYQSEQRRTVRQPSGTLLGFAPFFSGDTTTVNARLSQDLSLRSDFQPLPYSGEEVLRAKKRMKGESLVFTGADATRAKFMDLAGQYRILHLGTHAKANEKMGELSFIAFAATAGDTTKGLLYVNEIYNLALSADLVVLSACETGAGALQRGEGLISLARAFSFAGAKSVATALWKTNDESAMLVTDQFYAALKQKKSKTMALTLAKRRYLADHPGSRSHPFFWAGLVLTGIPL